MLAEELITTKTQERLPCNWVKIKVFFKKIASVPLGGSCESGGVPPLWEPPSQWEEISGDRQGASEESAATSLQEAEWRDIPAYLVLTTSMLYPTLTASTVLSVHWPFLDGGHDWCGSDQSLHWMFSRTSSLTSQTLLLPVVGIDAP